MNAADIIATVAVCFDANAIVRSAEMSVLNSNILHTSSDLASDRQSMSVSKVNVGNPYVFTRQVATRRIDSAGLDCNVVIANIRKQVINHHIATREWVDGIGVRRRR